MIETTAPPLVVERIPFGHLRFELARGIEYDVFGVANGYVTDDDRAAGEMLAYRPYQRGSEFHVLWHQPDVAAGVVRMLYHDADRGLDSFITLHDYRDASVGGVRRNLLDPTWEQRLAAQEPQTLAELATQAVSPQLRSPRSVHALWRSVFGVIDERGLRRCVMALVLPLFRWYRILWPDAIHAIGDIYPDYIGADSIPAVVDLEHDQFRSYRTRVENETRGRVTVLTAREGALSWD
jgi:hypothetical protein